MVDLCPKSSGEGVTVNKTCHNGTTTTYMQFVGIYPVFAAYCSEGLLPCNTWIQNGLQRMIEYTVYLTRRRNQAIQDRKIGKKRDDGCY